MLRWAEGSAEDWREFRARLVQQEQGEAGGTANESAPGTDASQGWAHVTPLIEQGSVLLSSPGDHFAINQQYFHKAVILITEHNDQGDIGLILNRPTAFRAADCCPSIAEIARNSNQEWNVWFGGDCEGLNPGAVNTQVPFCLHTSEQLAEVSQEIIKGVYLIPFQEAQDVVEAGTAEVDDFLLLVGYCGWGRGQMQSELDRGDTWTMAAADQRALLGELRGAQVALSARLRAAVEERRSAGSSVPLGAGDLGDGTGDWQRLYTALGPAFRERLGDARASQDDGHTDDMLRRWIDRCLVPLPLRAPAAQLAAASLVAAPEPVNLGAGTILRGSATAWLLGKPAEDEAFTSRRFPPAQFLHKSVLMLLQEATQEEPSILGLLNGPKVGETSDGNEVLFGGLNGLGGNGQSTFEVADGEPPLRLHGFTLLMPGILGKLLRLGALEVVQGMSVDDLAKVPAAERWAAAGGRVSSLFEASAALSGDVQRRKWYSRMLGLDVETEAGGA